MAYPKLVEGYVERRFGAESLGGATSEDEDTLPLAIRAMDVEPGDPVKWRVHGHIPSGELVLIVADGGVGKTTVALAIAGAVAGGYAVGDHPNHRAEQAPVLFVSEEDSVAVLANHLEALGAGHGWDPRHVMSNVHILALGGVQLSETRWQVHIASEAERVGAGLVVFDPLFEVSGADEDSNTQQRPVVKFCRALMHRTGAAVLVVHHFGKAGEGKRRIDRVRGASAWYNAARAVFALEERDDGLQVECLKMSRAAKPPAFVLERSVVADQHNPGIWRSATLRHRTVRSADLDLAQRWVLEQLDATEERLTTTDLKKLAVGSGYSGEQIQGALKHLELTRLIDFTPGNRGSKFWGRATLPGNVGNLAQSTLPTLPDGCPARSGGQAAPCPPPIGGKATVAAADGREAT
jgi:energy-coupling factor transporter ATP-binding protein EcfA2